MHGTEIFVIVPKGEDTSSRLPREIDLTFHPIIKTQPKAKVAQNLQVRDLFHTPHDTAISLASQCKICP